MMSDTNQHAAEFRRCLVDLDVATARRLWRHTSGHLAQPQSDQEMLVVLHHARTQAKSVPFKLRAYSHRWLYDNGFPSGMPDALKPRAERICPVVKTAVGISVKSMSSAMAPVAKIVEGAMSDTVMEYYADGVEDPAIIKKAMIEKQEKTLHRLLG